MAFSMSVNLQAAYDYNGTAQKTPNKKLNY